MMINSDLIFLQLDQSIDWSIYMAQPTACLLVIDNDISDALLTSIVVEAVNVGCTFFLTWGPKADLLEDRIDEVLENGDDDWLKISTIAFVNKPRDVVTNFLFVAAFPNRTDVRYFVIGDKPVDKLRELVIAQN